MYVVHLLRCVLLEMWDVYIAIFLLINFLLKE